MSLENNLVRIPLVALRGLVVFPEMKLHFDVGRAKSISAIEDAMKNNRRVFLAAQKNIIDEMPDYDRVYSVGCVAVIKQIIRMKDEGARVVVEGLYRAKAVNLVGSEPYLLVDVEPHRENRDNNSVTSKTIAMSRVIKDTFGEYCHINHKFPDDIAVSVMTEENVSRLCDFVAGYVNFSIDKKQSVLEEISLAKRTRLVAVMLKNELNLLKLEMEIQQKVQSSIDKNQREYYIREQLHVLSEELGEDDNPKEEAQVYHDKISKLKTTEEVKEKLLKEVSRLSKMPSGSHEATVVRNYLDTCVELPFGVKTKDKKDIAKAEKILDKDHYGLKKVKERIIELLAVKALSPDLRGQIICLVGPPGVGKTSIARSIAECLGRKYVRISLGGVRDEAEIRGHRRTYIGAMPGRIMDAVKRSKSQNPLILMDEIDKLGSDFKGDPSSALLEALDPEQNVEFHDHYLEIPFDLSDVLFVLTANSLDTIPSALLDRMEVIDLTGYTREEKFQIAKRHLLTKQLKKHSLTPSVCKVNDTAIYSIIDFYTREAGVRNLERKLATLSRKAAKDIVSSAKKVTITEKNIEKYLGVKRYKSEKIAKNDEVGLVNGLAWTQVGGEILQIETLTFPGSGKIILTGSLGDVMKESAQSAVSYIRSKSDIFNVDKEFYKNTDIHINATEGAVPKDGPSAGTAMTVCILSALTGTPIKRTVAMTGEVTLLGRVLQIGGLKEKTMAAYKSGVEKVIIPLDNLPDLSEIDDVVKDALQFVAIEKVEEILPHVFANDDYLRKENNQNNTGQEIIADIPADRGTPISNYS